MCGAGAKHKSDGKFRKSHKLSGPIYCMLMTDFSDRSMWMTEFSDTLVLWFCVTLGFFNSLNNTGIYSPPCMKAENNN
jgi:hypothetical protein